MMPSGGPAAPFGIRQVDFDLGFAPFAARMAAAGCGEPAIGAFAMQYARLLRGDTGHISEDSALPLAALPDAEDLPESNSAASVALDRLAIIKLNGGLGTSMGLDGPKSLLPVHDGLSFLDVLSRQVLALRDRCGAAVPLILMNSFSTDAATRRALAAYPELADQRGIPLSFLQGRVPKVRASDLAPIDWPEDPDKAWCPPGHGEIYQALRQTGLLDQLLAAGIDTAFISNVDNLGATIDPAILAAFRRHAWTFLMEVADRTAADRKGGHLARRPDGGFLLRELAQCPPEDLASFQDVTRHRFFNTNNLWVHLPTLADLLDRHGGTFDLPLIRNEKTVDPSRVDSPRVFQLESAMGAAIAAFPRAAALRVPRSRFRPVKKTGDLLGLWSDAFALGADGSLELRAERQGVAPIVALDEPHFGRVADLSRAFPHGAPSLLACDTLEVLGDVRFGRDIKVLGSVSLVASAGQVLHIPDGSILGEEP